MKKILFFIMLLFIGCVTVNAAPSYNFYVSSGTVENGKSVTASVTISNAAAWNVKITSSGNTNGCSNAWSDVTSNAGNTTKTFSVTCKATSIGAIGFTLSGDITSQDGANVGVSGNKRVSVVQPRPLSQNNYLGSLEVVDYKLDPEFNEEVTEYNVKVPSTVNEIEIKAAVKDRYASLTGDGKFEVEEGPNEFKVVVTAENGSQKEYVVVVTVEDPNPIVLELEGKKYTIVKNLKNIESPTLFTPSTITIDGTEVPSFVSDVSKFTLVAVKDESGKLCFAIVNDDGTYSLYKVVNVGNLLFYIMNGEKDFDNFEKATLTLGDFEIDAYRSTDDENIYLVYGMNVSTNNEGWYKYDALEGTLQKYDNSYEMSLKDKMKQYLLIIVIFGAGLLLSIVATIVIFVSSNSKVKKMALIIASKRVDEVKANITQTEESSGKDKKVKVKKTKKKDVAQNKKEKETNEIVENEKGIEKTIEIAKSKFLQQSENNKKNSKK